MLAGGLNNLMWHVAVFIVVYVAVISRMDTTSARDVKYKEIWRYCFQGQRFQDCH